MSHIDNFSNKQKNLQLFWKIPPRIFLTSNLSYNNVNYLPLYNNLIIEYKEKNDINWKELININNFPDPSNNNFNSNYNSKNDLSMVFILNLSRNTAISNDTNNINIIDNSFIINYTAGFNSFQNSKSYQFRSYLTNISNLQNNYDYKEDNYGNNSSNIYLYFPDISNLYLDTASRGFPKSPTNLFFNNIFYNSVLVNGELDDTTVDSNEIIFLPIPNADISNTLVFVFDLIANKINSYKKFIQFNENNYLINNITELSKTSSFNINLTNNIEPEYNYEISNYGMYFFDDFSKIGYLNINNNFITPSPLRNNINNSFNYTINNINIFENNLNYYNNSITHLQIVWRSNGNILGFNFFDNNSNLLEITKNNSNIKLYNSINSNLINQSNELKGIDLSLNNLCSFELKTENLNGNNFNYNSFNIETSFNNFLTKNINNNNNNYFFNYISQDILPYNSNSLTDYSKTNGYYVGLIIKDISFNINLNDFYDINSDLSKNNITLKTSIKQIFSNTIHELNKSYLIYKITQDLTKIISIDNSNGLFNFNYQEEDLGHYFGLKSIKPHNSNIFLEISGNLIDLNKYIRRYDNSTLCIIDLFIKKNNLTNINIKNKIINWPNNNESNINITSTKNDYRPLAYLNSLYGFYEGTDIYNAYTNFKIFNNLFSQNLFSNYNNMKIGTSLNIDKKYYWNIEKINSVNNYFNESNMIIFDNNPLNNIDHNTLGGILYQPNLNNAYIKYNQALYQYNGNKLFYSANKPHVYKNYLIYEGNNDSNLDYSIYDNSGDIVNYDINIPFWFASNIISKTINNIYKWVSFDIDLTSISLISDTILLDLNNVDINTIGTNYLFYIKLKYDGNLQITGQNIIYSKWFDCLSILNTGFSDSQRVKTNLSGIYDNNISAGTYPLKLILPYLSSYASNLTLLIGLYNTELNINNINIYFNQ